MKIKMQGWKNSGISLKNTFDNKYNITTKLKMVGKAQAVIYDKE